MNPYNSDYDSNYGCFSVLLVLSIGILIGCIFWLGDMANDLQTRLDIATQRAINAEAKVSTCEKENKRFHSISAANTALCRKWVKELPPEILIGYGGLELMEGLNDGK